MVTKQGPIVHGDVDSSHDPDSGNHDPTEVLSSELYHNYLDAIQRVEDECLTVSRAEGAIAHRVLTALNLSSCKEMIDTWASGTPSSDCGNSSLSDCIAPYMREKRRIRDVDKVAGFWDRCSSYVASLPVNLVYTLIQRGRDSESPDPLYTGLIVPPVYIISQVIRLLLDAPVIPGFLNARVSEAIVTSERYKRALTLSIADGVLQTFYQGQEEKNACLWGKLVSKAVNTVKRSMIPDSPLQYDAEGDNEDDHVTVRNMFLRGLTCSDFGSELRTHNVSSFNDLKRNLICLHALMFGVGVRRDLILQCTQEILLKMKFYQTAYGEALKMPRGDISATRISDELAQFSRRLYHTRTNQRITGDVEGSDNFDHGNMDIYVMFEKILHKTDVSSDDEYSLRQLYTILDRSESVLREELQKYLSDIIRKSVDASKLPCQ